jgi:hypothetical protein
MVATDIASMPRAGVRRAVDLQPYLIGAGIGVLSWIVFVVVNAPLGITTSMAQLAANAAAPMVGWESVARNSYWAKQLPKLDYGTLFLAGTMLGGLLSALFARSWRLEAVPAMWAERFGPSPLKRYAYAFVGGMIAMYGARLANGCTSGNGISGGLQLAVSGWTFLAVMFLTGTLTAFVMYRAAR